LIDYTIIILGGGVICRDIDMEDQAL
jgi:hypothetical protein